jgi:hypothetical protein
MEADKLILIAKIIGWEKIFWDIDKPSVVAQATYPQLMAGNSNKYTFKKSMLSLV